MAMFYFVKRLATLRIVTEPTFIDNKLIKQKVIKEEKLFKNIIVQQKQCLQLCYMSVISLDYKEKYL